MNENLNIAEILIAVGAKEGYPLYSTLLGDCKLLLIDGCHEYICVESSHCAKCVFLKDGRWYDESECLLFPSKDNRDWNTVKPECPFKPYDKVLVRDEDNMLWKCDFFSHYKRKSLCRYITADGAYTQCIPYEGNEHLVGTTGSTNE